MEAATTLFTLALAGNPNCGKSTLFNQLTGLRQKTGNFPGVTVERKSGIYHSPGGAKMRIVDLPGTYSLHPTSQDERIVSSILCNPRDPDYPDAILYIADITHLDKHMLLFTQLYDLGIPIVLVLNMLDLAEASSLEIDTGLLARHFGVPVVALSSRKGTHMDILEQQLEKLSAGGSHEVPQPVYQPDKSLQYTLDQVSRTLQIDQPYRAKLLAHHHPWLPFLNAKERGAIAEIVAKNHFRDLPGQIEETLARYDVFEPLIQRASKRKKESTPDFSSRVDRVVTHPVAGPLIFIALMILVFQAIFDWSSYPMDWIESLFLSAGDWVRTTLPAGWFSDLLADGILAGLGGIFVFVPQIALLFLLISLLEESGYMARAVFLFDRLMQGFGMNGRSIVSLISGGACAIPAVLATRTISNWKERLITILVLPFISCSARIPVYTVLIGLVIPARKVAGFLNLQGLVFMGLYALGIFAALGAAWILKKILRSRDRSYLMIELPPYRMPVWRNVGLTIWEKSGAFVVGAGKIILLFSVILWVLASYGPPGAMENASARAQQEAGARQLDAEAAADLEASHKIEASFAGELGHWIEPAIAPLGFDWKIGIALITSFAAREVFVASMATIYSIGSHAEDDQSIRERMAKETHEGSGLPVYTLATGMSLLVFYVLAMQCMSTLAIVKRETHSWKWPLLQFSFMSGLAYLGSWITYLLLN